MAKMAIVLYGPPGSGKGTQAVLLADKLDLVHVNSGVLLENIINDPARQKNPIIKREKKLFATGKMLTPSWVLPIIMNKAKQVHRAGEGVVFSGSLRTLYEAEKLLPLLEHLYGKKNIIAFVINVGPKASIVRNSARLLCSFCGVPVLTAYYPTKNPTHCPRCGAKLYKRVLDNTRTVVDRLKEYRDRTEPVFAFLRKKGYRVHAVNGELPPYKVFERIYGYIHKNARGN